MSFVRGPLNISWTIAIGGLLSLLLLNGDDGQGMPSINGEKWQMVLHTLWATSLCFADISKFGFDTCFFMGLTHLQDMCGIGCCRGKGYVKAGIHQELP